MVEDKRSRDKPGVAKSARKAEVLSSLQAEEAAEVLRRLISAHPELRAEAEEIASASLRAISFEDVADEVEDAARQLDPEDLYGRAGGHSWGYVTPDEAAVQMLEEALEPFLGNMRRYLDLGLEKEALEVCKGIVLGLYRVRNETENDVLGWATDFPAEAAGDAVAGWLSGGGQKAAGGSPASKRRVFPQEFMDAHVPEWRESLQRVVARETG
jgi:hypothetical protein